jgi:hypothetical protein
MADDTTKKKKKKEEDTSVSDYFGNAYAEAARNGYLGTKAQVTQETRDKKKKTGFFGE